MIYKWFDPYMCIYECLRLYQKIFPFAGSIVLTHSICNDTSSHCLGGPSGEPISLKLFGLAGTAYISAMCCSMGALNYVNFPTKELGKSCKVSIKFT